MLTPTLSSIGESKNHIIAELIRNQIIDVEVDRKLSHTDFKRMVRYLNVSIFTPDVCSLWQGYVTDRKKKNKGSYVNFYFKKKKVALHRLLYLNFLGPLADDEYVKFKCDHKGYCCSVHCLEKHKYKRIPLSYGSKSVMNSQTTPRNDSETFVEKPFIVISEERLNVLFI